MPAIALMADRNWAEPRYRGRRTLNGVHAAFVDHSPGIDSGECRIVVLMFGPSVGRVDCASEPGTVTVDVSVAGVAESVGRKPLASKNNAVQ